MFLLLIFTLYFVLPGELLCALCIDSRSLAKFASTYGFHLDPSACMAGIDAICNGQPPHQSLPPPLPLSRFPGAIHRQRAPSAKQPPNVSRFNPH